MSYESLKGLLQGRAVVNMYLNFGPYHVARLRAIAHALKEYGARLVAIELARREKVYPWRVEPQKEPFEWRTLVNDAAVEDVPPRVQRLRMKAALQEIDPAAVVIPGYSGAAMQAAASWCRRRGVLSVVSGDSSRLSRTDGAHRIGRPWYMERYKRWLVRGFSAAQASGNSARDYFVSLGVPRERVVLKYDVVDNAFFRDLADDTRRNLPHYREAYEVPVRFFLVPGRVMEIKNHLAFLESYRKYVEQAGSQAWGLLILGSGPLEKQVDARIAELDLPWVQRRGYAQPDDLARYYALASALVLPSRSETWGLVVNEANAAGCPVLVSKHCFVCEHLVVDGENGWTFDPYNLEEMAGLLTRMAALSDAERERMGRAGRKLVRDWDTADHAQELLRAITLGSEACGAR